MQVMTGHFHGDRLRDIRTAAGMTQDALAAEIGARVGRKHTDTAVRGWEQGHRNPQLHDIIALADVFGVSVDYLVGRVPRPDAIVATRGGVVTIVELKTPLAAEDHEAVVDRAADAAQQVAEAMGTGARTPRRKRA